MKLNNLAMLLGYYYKNAPKAEKIIVGCAFTAAGATAVGGMFPVLALPSMIISCFGAVWTMYIQLCKCLEIPIGENILKVLASAALSNIAANLLSVFAVEIITAVIPGVGAVAGAAATFACIYLAGMMFMEMLLAFARNGKVGSDLSGVSASELADEIKNHTPTREDARDARNSFETNYAAR